SVGGRIQFHSIYASPEGAFYAGKIPLKKDSLGEKGQLIMSARDSRLWVKTRTPSEYGPVRALIEIDFLGVSGTETNTNSHGLRLRHAYVEGNGFTFGQTNSAFNSNVTLDTISYAVNDTLVRQPLIRYSIDDRLLAYDISFEQPETTLLDPDGNIITPKDDLLPDIIARVRYYPSWGEMSSAFLARYIKQDHTKLSNGNDVNSSDTAIAWGVNISAKIKTYKLDDIRFDAQYGKGMGRYIAYNAYAAGSIDANGDIKLQPAFGAHIGYRHWWSETLRSTFAYSYTGTNNNLDDLNVTNLDRVNKDVYSWQLNLLWTPVKNGLAGIEYARALRNVESDERGEMDLLILLLRYDF
ncbi:MAG: DcaP family trimeric outer membrane transporter, partial [Campylobacterota bacterium]|nr:DcaP family trimeric outer membrane transporter [Campylobacterota bacterium]